jgi:hypothetical protein
VNPQKKPGACAGLFQIKTRRTCRDQLLDDLHNAVRARIDQHGAVVDHGIP